MAVRYACAQIFQDIPWSTPHVLNMTLERAKAVGLSVALLEEYSDVDTFDDLEKLRINIERLRNTPGARVPLETEAWIKENLCRYHQYHEG